MSPTSLKADSFTRQTTLHMFINNLKPTLLESSFISASFQRKNCLSCWILITHVPINHQSPKMATCQQNAQSEKMQLTPMPNGERLLVNQPVNSYQATKSDDQYQYRRIDFDISSISKLHQITAQIESSKEPSGTHIHTVAIQ